MNDEILNANKAAEYLGIHIRTLQGWDNSGKLPATLRTPGNKRMYSKTLLDSFLNKPRATTVQKIIVYARVSSKNQRQDLVNQKQSLTDFCNALGLANFDLIEEIGGGLNFERPKFLEIIHQINNGLVSKLIVAHKDRLCRFGFELVEQIAKVRGCEIVVLNNEKQSPQEEMVTDLMTIVHCFSSRLYGLRSYKSKIQAAATSV